MKIWQYPLIVCLFVSGCSFNPFDRPAAATGPVPTAEVEQQLQGLWNRLDKGSPPANKLPVAWSPTYSVLFPSEWPPTPNMIWIRYAYAQGIDMELVDGMRVAAPWARLEQRGSLDTVTIIPLSTHLEPMTVQGSGPIDARTQGVLTRGGVISAACLKLTALPQPNDPATLEMRAYYRTWMQYNGGLVAFIRKNHEKFLAWVNE
jgi:hypothetical protein